MPGLIFLVGFLVVATSDAVIQRQSAKNQAQPKQTAIVRVTTYYQQEGGRLAAYNGIRLREGHCAVDPHKIPYGSRIRLGNEELVAVDTGPAVVSRKAARLSGHNPVERNAVVVDRFFESRAQAKAWEKSHPHFLVAQILPPPSAGKPNDPKS